MSHKACKEHNFYATEPYSDTPIECPYCELSATQAELEEAKKQIENKGRGRLTTYWVERAEAAERERDELREWKRSQIEVTSACDLQAIGKLIGCPLGHSIYPHIEPYLVKVNAENQSLRTECERLKEHFVAQNNSIENLVDQVIAYKDENATYRRALEYIAYKTVTVDFAEEIAREALGMGEK